MKEHHIVFITSGHSPFSSRLFHKELRSLKKKYTNLAIVAPYHKKTETIENIRIVGIRKYRSRYNRWHALYSLYKKASALSPDILHCHEPDSLMVAYILKKRFPEIRVIYDCHEFHPQGFTENFPHLLRGIAKLLIERVENFLVSKVDGVVTVNRRLAKRFTKNNKSVIILPNYPPLDIFEKNERKREVLSARNVRLIYVGGLSTDRGLFRMLEMLRGLNSLGNVQLILIGKFSSSELKRRFWQKTAELNLVNKIDYKGYLSHEETVLSLLDADIGLFLLSDNERYNWGEPIKYFEYSAAGLPVVITDLPAKRALIEKNRNGILVSPGSSEDAVNAVRSLIDNADQARIMSERGRRTFLKEYNWESVENRLFGLYGRL